MRIDVKKFLFIGSHNEREKFFKKAQRAGLIHFIDLVPTEQIEVPKEIEEIGSAIKVLRGLPTVEQEEMTDYSKSDEIARHILKLKHRIESLEEEKRVIRLEIARVEVFGHFSLEDIATIEKQGNRKIQFFFAKKGVFDDQPLPEGLIYVASDHGLDYFVAINKETTYYDHMIEMQIEHPFGTLKERFAEVERELHTIEEELKPLAKYNEYLHHALVFRMNAYNLHSTENFVEYALDERLFAVEGWVPVDKIEVIETLVKSMHVHMEEIAVEEDDAMPTYLENSGPARIGEDLVHIYDTPSTTDKDPSLWVLGAFSLFFAMIIGDAGYGLLFLGIALYLRWKFPNPKKVAKRVLDLVTILSVACITWGVLTNSFFGLNIGPESPLRNFSALNWLAEKKAAYHIDQQDETYQEWVGKIPQLKGVSDPQEFLKKGTTESEGKISYALLNKFSDNIMMELALFIGVAHICLSLLRYLGRNWAAIGWVVLIVGGYFYFPSYLGASSMLEYVFGLDKDFLPEEGIYMMVGGLGIALFLSLIQNKLLGLLEITNIIQIFADILSYLRLYALGLASAILAGTVNDVAGSTIFVVGMLIAVIGHSVNMGLGIMSGVIHGLRLNFLEWYHYSFEGDGKLFAPLKKMEIE